jgi:hypothetical protein
MDRFAPLPALCLAMLAATAGAAQADTRPNAPDHAACRKQALAEGLRSEEVILDYIHHECLETGRDADHSSAAPSATGHSAGRASAPPRTSPAALN